MAIVNEVIVTGRKKRRLIDKAAKLWQRISYWTHASDVEFDDGKTAQEKLGNINGITDDPECSEGGIVVSASALNKVRQAFQDGCDKIVGKITALGATVPEPTNNLDNIITGIQNAYDKAIANVKANPTAYGLTTGVRISGYFEILNAYHTTQRNDENTKRLYFTIKYQNKQATFESVSLQNNYEWLTSESKGRHIWHLENMVITSVTPI